jgi:hypothetical protein
LETLSQNEVESMITAEEYVKATLRGGGLTSGDVKECFNCQEVVIDDNLDIWIEHPQPGHWLKDHEWDSLTKFIEARL